ncbi:amidohydrolase family protein [Candidatus Palauibacter sp.]|uniref:amidohydrolase family protein n=1 Tax=Candidatus Palauibacter sp. TaxID=3101350 RepID=UPI003AF29DAD
MSVDVAPDDGWVVFDLLGHVYRVSAEGGEAVALTQTSGVAINFHPRISPDGRSIAFVSDRGGQNNLWVMDADGGNPRPVFEDMNGDQLRVVEPTWTPDSRYIVVRRYELAGARARGIWMYHRDGGEGVELVGDEVENPSWPSVSADGRYLYFHVNTPGQGVAFAEAGLGGFDGFDDAAGPPGAERDALQGAYNLRRMDLGSGEIISITHGEPSRQYRLSSGGAWAPEVSPDGRWLAFARRIPDGTILWKGHEYGPRTALWLRDLRTGAERVIMDPIERDMVEDTNTLRVLPGYSWSRDGRSIILAQGGKIRRLHVESGEVGTIPFEARVHRVISEQAYAPLAMGDDAFRARFTRWQVGSPDGRRLAFQAVGKVWVMDVPAGTPQRLTPDSFTDFEYSPAWSPDGEWIAFTSVDEAGGGHLWKARAGEGGGSAAPTRLSDEYGEYSQTVWSPDGERIMAARGSGVTARTRTYAHGPWFDIVLFPPDGGGATEVTRVSGPTLSTRTQFVRPSFGPDGRIFYPQLGMERGESSTLVSVRADGSDRREHASFPFADEIVISPGGDWIAFNEGDNVYLTPLPAGGTAGDPVVVDKKNGTLPVHRLSRAGGLFPSWRDGRTVQFGSGPTYIAYDVTTGRADTTEIDLRVPRDFAPGTIALTDARIITLEDRQVVESGTVLVRDGRIACVGECDTTGADRVESLAGKTIIPGFIDMHSHFFREYRGIIPMKAFEAAVPLAYGVTSNMDNSMWSQDVFPAAELIEAGMLIGPRTYSTGDPLYLGDAARQNDITSYAVAEEEIERLQSWGAVSIKQYLQPRRDQRQWVSDIARRRGLMVTSQGNDLLHNLTKIMDGQTAWEHSLTYAPIYGDVAKFFGRAEAVYSPTFNTRAGPWSDEYWFGESDVWLKEKLRAWMPWQQLVGHTRRRALRPKTDYIFPIVAQGLADIMAEGGRGAIGGHGQQHGICSHWEVWMAATALGAMGALELASVEGAYFLGAEDDLGTISVGKLADLMVLSSNPLDDIRNTEDIAYVMKGGRLYLGDTLDEMWPRQKPYGARPWVNADALRIGPVPVDIWDSRSSGGPR